jgi:hypothetical protein
MKILTPEEQHTLHHRYKQNDLYRQWMPILAMLQRNYGVADAQTLWHEAECVIVRLREEQTFREQEIAPIYNALLAETSHSTATTVMCIIMTMLINAVDRGHEDEYFDNEPMCMAIADIFLNDTFFHALMKQFFSRSAGYDGKKVVITPSDPMLEETAYECMNEIAKEEIDSMVQKVVSHTKGLSFLFGTHWTAWEPLWRDICTDTQLMLMMKAVQPRGNDWGINLKMVCNVIGIFKDNTHTEVTIKNINDAVCPKNIRNYVSNYAARNSSDAVLNKEQRDRIKKMIEKYILSQKDN